MTQPMKIMQILPALHAGGVERGTIEIAKALTQQGIPNIVVSSGGPMAYELKRIGVRHITLPVQSKNPFKIWMNARKLRQVIKEESITIVHARSRAPAWVAKIALKKCPGVRFLTTFHGVYNLGPWRIKKPYNRVMASGDLVISISNFVTRHILDQYHIASSRIRLIYRGADIEKFDPLKVSQERIAELAGRWQVPLDKPVMMLPGRLTRWKGHSALLEALAKMKNKNVTCIFVGSDQGRTDYHHELKERIEKLDPETSVIIEDHCSDMPVAYMLADIVVSASTDPEAFGRVIPEAQAMGRLVVGTDHGGATETIQNGKTGFLVPPGDATALASTLDMMLEMNLGERKKMSMEAMKSVHDYFSIQKMCEKTIAVYEELSTEAPGCQQTPK